VRHHARVHTPLSGQAVPVQAVARRNCARQASGALNGPAALIDGSLGGQRSGTKEQMGILDGLPPKFEN